MISSGPATHLYTPAENGPTDCTKVFFQFRTNNYRVTSLVEALGFYGVKWFIFPLWPTVKYFRGDYQRSRFNVYKYFLVYLSLNITTQNGYTQGSCS